MMLRNRFVRVVALLVICMLPLRAQEPSQPKPFARVRLEPGPRVTVGQRVTVAVEILVPTWFTGAPRFPDLDVADAITVFEDRGTNFTERIDNQTWAGQSRQYHVYPQRQGLYEIPAIPIRVRYNAEGGGARAEVTVSPRQRPTNKVGLRERISAVVLLLSKGSSAHRFLKPFVWKSRVPA